MKKILVFDPGKSTGVFYGEVHNRRLGNWTWAEIEYEKRHEKIAQIFNKVLVLDTVLIEQYVIFAGKNAHVAHVHTELFGPKVISVIETIMWVQKHSAPIKFYSPSVKENQTIDPEMRGRIGSEHARDAYKIFKYHALHNGLL